MVDLDALNKDADLVVSLALGVPARTLAAYSIESKAQVEFSYLSYLTQLNTMRTIQEGNAMQAAIQSQALASQATMQKETLGRMDNQIKEMKKQGIFTLALAGSTLILALANIIPLVLKYIA